MNSIKIQLVDCIQCGNCEAACLYNAIYTDEYPIIEPERCLLCKSCIQACPLGLITLDEGAKTTQTVENKSASGIWVLAEFQNGFIAPVTYELLGAARHLAQTNKGEVSVILISDKCRGWEETLFAGGADRIYIAENIQLADKLEGVYTDILVALARRHQPNIFLIGATRFGRGISSRVATLLHTGLTADCIQLELDSQTKNLLQIRPAFGGNLLATIETLIHKPQMASVRPGIMKALKPDRKRTGEIIHCNINHLLTDNSVELLAEEIVSSSSSLHDASVIIAGGRGMQSKENIRLLYELADLLGGEVAASRAAVEAGWLPYECQIGQTGKTVAPRLYIACGISGQVQHTVAVSQAETIIAINNDPDAPIFQYADYGMVGDITEILPALIKELQGRKQEVPFF